MDHVISADGTRIAFTKTGAGPPLVLVHGSLNDQNAWAAVAPLLAHRYTVYALARRGRGESGPPTEHALTREFEDVAAVVKAAGEPVDVVGHSFGGHCALGAAMLEPALVKRLVLYEPPTREQVAGLADDFERSDPSEAIARFFERTIGMSQVQIEAMKASPFWPYFVSHAPSMPSEARALIAHSYDTSRLAALTTPTLFVVGSETRERLGAMLRELEPHLRSVQWCALAGQGHGAMRMAPDLFANAVVSFLQTHHQLPQ